MKKIKNEPEKGSQIAIKNGMEVTQCNRGSNASPAVLPQGYEWLDGCIAHSVESKDGDIFTEKITSSAIWIHCAANSQKHESWNFIFRLKNRDGHLIEFKIEYQDLYCTQGALHKRIAQYGVLIAPKKLKVFTEFIFDMAVMVKSKILIEQPGWVKGCLTFALPSRVLGNDESVINGISDNGILSISGSLIDWQARVLQRVANDPLRLFSIMAALASPLLELLKMEGGGFHYYGLTSRGKTILLEVGSTVWGVPADMLLSWHLTGNGLEGRALDRSSIGMFLDELGMFRGKGFGSLVYTIARGEVKVRMNKDRTSSPKESWDIIFQSTGELSMRDKVISEGESYRDGMGCRLIDIPMPDLDDSNIEEGKTLADAVKQACACTYGSAGPFFIEALIGVTDTREKLEALLLERFQAIEAELVRDEMKSEQQRAVKRFALVKLAGTLAMEAGVLNVTTEQLDSAVNQALDLWYTNPESLGMTERGLQNVRSYIQRYRSKFANASDSERHIGEIIGYYRDGGNHVLMIPEIFKEACGDVSDKVVLKALRDQGYLNTQSNPEREAKLKGRMKIKGSGRQYGILIYNKFFDIVEELDDTKPEGKLVSIKRPKRPSSKVEADSGDASCGM